LILTFTIHTQVWRDALFEHGFGIELNVDDARHPEDQEQFLNEQLDRLLPALRDRIKEIVLK